MQNKLILRNTENPEENELFISESKGKLAKLTSSENNVHISENSFEFLSNHQTLTATIIKDGILTFNICSKTAGQYRFKHLSHGKVMKYDWMDTEGTVDFTVHKGDRLFLISGDIENLKGKISSDAKKQLCIKVDGEIITLSEL